MSFGPRPVGGLTAAIVFAFAVPGHAQTLTSSLSDLSVLIGARVEVVDAAGRVVTGKLVGVSDAGLRLLGPGRKDEVLVTADRIALVGRRRADSLHNGAVIGAAVLAALPLAIVASERQVNWRSVGRTSLVWAALGAYAGAAVDASRQRRVVLYQSPGPGLSPMPTPSGAWPNLGPLVGERLEVRNDDDSVATGKLLQASDTTLVIDGHEGPLNIPRQKIRAITLRDADSVSNGILYGGLLGAAAAVVIGKIPRTDEPMLLYTVPWGVLIGVAIGWIGDTARITKVPVQTAGSVRVNIAPILGGGRRGLALVVRF